MNLSIEDLEAIKAIVREVVKEELKRFEGQHQVVGNSDHQVEQVEQNHQEQPQEVVARIPRV